jgi:hypothetical protein
MGETGNVARRLGASVMRTTGQMGAAVGLAASPVKNMMSIPEIPHRINLNEYLNLIEEQKYLKTQPKQ